jgi:DNA repair protein RadC
MKNYKSNVPLVTLKRIQTDFPKAAIRSSKDSAKFIKQFYVDDISIFESFFILMLNRSNTTIGYAKISQGGITGTSVDVRLIAKYAVDSLCCGVILAHNHPSGNLMPSRHDIELTKKVKSALSLFDIQVIDHVILTDSDSYCSLADEGNI